MLLCCLCLLGPNSARSNWRTGDNNETFVGLFAYLVFFICLCIYLFIYLFIFYLFIYLFSHFLVPSKTDAIGIHVTILRWKCCVIWFKLNPRQFKINQAISTMVPSVGEF